MLLKKIHIKNLRSYKEQKITFPKGSTLLSGDIGSGKTTILLAIEFALFGLQPSQKATALLKNGEEEASVTLNFEIENKEITIERTLKKKGKSIGQDYASITIDNEKYEASITEVKNKILELLNYPKEFSKKTNLLYKFTVYTPQEEMKQIIQESRDIRLNTLRHVFGIDKYKRIQENSSILASKLREKIRINQTLISELDKTKENLIEKQTFFQTLKQNQIKINTDSENATKNRQEKENLLNAIQEKINEKKKIETEKEKSELMKNEKSRQIIFNQNSLKNIQEQIKQNENITFNKEEYDSLDQRINFQEQKENEIQKEYLDIISRINSLNSKKSEIQDLKNKISNLRECPTCLQQVTEEYKNNIFSNADSEEKQIFNTLTKLTEKRNELIQKIEETKKQKEEFKKRKSELELIKLKIDSLKDKKEQKQQIENQIASLKKDLEHFDELIKKTEISIKEYEKYDEIFREKDEELKKAKTTENELLIKKAEINKEIQFTEQQILELDKQIKEKEKLQKNIELLRALEYWISNDFLNLILFTEKQIMITLKEEFSRLFSTWFSTLVSDSLTATLDDDFSPIIMQQDYELDYAFLSGGERTAIALAYRLSLNQVINSILSNLRTSNIIILDEPTDGFSTQQLDKMRDILNQLNISQLILVSHEPKIESFVDNIIKIKKDGGVSQVDFN